LEFFLNDLLENFRPDQPTDSGVLLKEYIIQIIYIIIVATITKTTNKTLSGYPYVLVKDLLKKPKN
jgi:hypothetical protein